MKQISRPRALFALPLFASLQIAAGASSPAWSQSSPASLAQRSVAAAKPASPQQPPATQQGSTAGCPIVHEQLPDFFAATFSDSAEPQVVADNLILAADTEVCQLSILGVFAFGSQISPGSFDLIVHEDAGGFPGPVVYSESGITPSFTLTGDVLNFPVGTFDVYRVDIIPAGPILLLGGVTYWLEIFYNSDPSNDNWTWLTAFEDPDSGLAGSVTAFETPGVNWTNDGAEFAIQVFGVAGCPTVHEQLPNFFGVFVTDSAEPSSNADNLMLAVNTEVCQLSVVGGFLGANQISPGSFDLIVHEDAGGLPGPVVYSESGITPSFTLTGDVLSFTDLFRADIIPAGPILLLGGVTYWFEIFYNSDPNDEPWAWATASPDPDSGLAGSALASEAPGVNWTNETQDLAIEVFGVESLDGIGTPICAPANTNSTGGSGTLLANGSDLAADNNLTFTAAGLPLGQVGYLVNSMNTQMLPISDGLLCIGPGFGRHVTKAGNSDMFGEISTTVDLTSLPRSSGPEPVLAGQTWYFQFWHRDGNASNFTNALEILFQ